MNISLLLQMAADELPDRTAIGELGSGFTFSALGAAAGALAARVRETGMRRVVLLDVNGPAVAVGLFGAAASGAVFVPLNYRSTDAQLAQLVQRLAPAFVIVGPETSDRLERSPGLEVITRDDVLAPSGRPAPPPGAGSPTAEADPDEVAVSLFTSGTTGTPKEARLRHRHLVSYVIGTVDFASAGGDEAVLVSVPPYHVAAISAVLTATYAGRRTVHLATFEPQAWVTLAAGEAITHSMVVPTMLARILDVLDATGERLPSLRALSYGGGPMPVEVIERALTLLPHVDFVNAYGLTETSSTITLLDATDHRAAHGAADPGVRVRLGSVGRPLPGIELTIRDERGNEVPHRGSGEVWVRGEQVSGEYEDGSHLDPDGWFPTRDQGHVDEDGYLFLSGRLDDVIVRGGENIAPVEVETVLRAHPAVADAAVFGVPHVEWGEQVLAAVVLREGPAPSEDELRAAVRARLRSVKTPDRVFVRAELPYSVTGKLERRRLREEVVAQRDGPSEGGIKC